MPRFQEPPFPRSNQYQPRLPSDNALDYYLVAARSIQGNGDPAHQPPKPEDVRWIQQNERAFRILQQGVSKPYRWVIEYRVGDPPFPDFAALRNLARLVAGRIRLAIATKDGMDAVRDWRVGVHMAWDIQGDMMLNYLVGVAMEAMVHAPIVSEMDFFSSAECRAMADTLIRMERSPDRFPSAIEGERAFALRWLDEMLPPGKPETLLEVVRTDWNMDPQTGKPIEPEEPAEDEEEEKLRAEERRQYERLRPQMLAIAQSPTAYEELRASLRREINRWAEESLRVLRLPYGRQLQALREPASREDTPFSYFAELLRPMRSPLLSGYLTNRARRRLMLVHLMLRVYRLQYGNYPDTLHTLKLEELIIDPFSGRELVYKREGERYRLYSVGQDGKDDGGHRPQPGEHPVEGDAIPRDLFLTRDGWR
ncbi:hypothetical protein HRbin16_03288 [bacterium HR16]|nr:hypothetical protein HRbin16_03288 [bacterium HR16]